MYTSRSPCGEILRAYVSLFNANIRIRVLCQLLNRDQNLKYLVLCAVVRTGYQSVNYPLDVPVTQESE